MSATLTNGVTFQRLRNRPGVYVVRLWGERIGRVERVRVAHRGRLVLRWETYAPSGVVSRTNLLGHFQTRTEAANALAATAQGVTP